MDYIVKKEYVTGYIEYRILIDDGLVDRVNKKIRTQLAKYPTIPTVTTQDLIDFYFGNYCPVMYKTYDFFFSSYDWEGVESVKYEMTLGEYVEEIIDEELWKAKDIERFLDTIDEEDIYRKVD